MILDRGAVIGASMDSWMLYPPGNLGWGGHHPERREVFAREDVTLQNLADYVEHVCQLAGNATQAAIGGDIDGQAAARRGAGRRGFGRRLPEAGCHPAGAGLQ